MSLFAEAQKLKATQDQTTDEPLEGQTTIEETIEGEDSNKRNKIVSEYTDKQTDRRTDKQTAAVPDVKAVIKKHEQKDNLIAKLKAEQEPDYERINPKILKDQRQDIRDIVYATNDKLTIDEIVQAALADYLPKLKKALDL